MDINKVWLSGVATGDPVMTLLPSRTPIAAFMLQVNEHFEDRRDGEVKTKSSLIKIETLGRQAESTMNKVRRGCRYFIDGYIRQDRDPSGVDQVAVRVFALYPDTTYDAIVFNDGIRQALDAVRRSRDRDTAIQALEGLLAAR